MRALLLLTCVVVSGCFTGWKSEGPWACVDSACPDGFTCDDGVCCKPGSSPACPTLPVSGACPDGGAPTTYFNDADGDGVGWSDSGRPFCREPQLGGWVDLGGDCNDADDTVGPRASERCNAKDDDCDGVIDDGLLNFTWYRDGDGDGFGCKEASCVLLACVQPDGYVSQAGDCDDALNDVYPGAPERCNQRDDNCNGQLDDAPFVDVENPGTNDPARFDCTTTGLGVCAAGGWQCVYSAVDARYERRCVPRSLPSTDVCGDNLDNDCNGGVDNQPGCGGPADVTTAAGVVMGAFILNDAGSWTPPGCLRTGGTESMSWLRPAWIGTNGRLNSAFQMVEDYKGLHVLHADAPAGQWWDLSENPTLHLTVTNIGVGGGPWNQDDGTLRSLTVQLCGPGGTFARYTPGVGQRLVGGSTASLDIPLQGSATWVLTAGGLDLKRVDRIELLAAPSQALTFTNTFAADGGFGFKR